MLCAWINGWVNNREAGDVGRQCAHYDVTVMYVFEVKCIDTDGAEPPTWQFHYGVNHGFIGDSLRFENTIMHRV